MAAQTMIETEASETEQPLGALISDAVRRELDTVVPHVITALKRNEAVTALIRRLDDAERQLTERQQRPMVAGVRRVLTLVRRLNIDAHAKAALEVELTSLLTASGYDEFDATGELFDPLRHEVVDGMAENGSPVVAHVYEPGLETLGQVVVRAKVAICSGNDWPAYE